MNIIEKLLSLLFFSIPQRWTLESGVSVNQIDLMWEPRVQQHSDFLSINNLLWVSFFKLLAWENIYFLDFFWKKYILTHCVRPRFKGLLLALQAAFSTTTRSNYYKEKEGHDFLVGQQSTKWKSGLRIVLLCASLLLCT